MSFSENRIEKNDEYETYKVSIAGLKNDKIIYQCPVYFLVKCGSNNSGCLVDDVENNETE